MSTPTAIRILLADDDTDFVDVTAYALRKAGFIVSAAADGHQALELWRLEEPDIVLLDVGMPGRNGLEVCRAIRARSTTPVVLLTGRRRDHEVTEGFEAGADDYITKPFRLQQLVMRLQALYRRSSG